MKCKDRQCTWHVSQTIMHACRTSPNVSIELPDIHNTLWLPFDNKSILLHCIAWKSNLCKNLICIENLCTIVYVTPLCPSNLTVPYYFSFFGHSLFFLRGKQSECDYWIPDMILPRCKRWLCWHDMWHVDMKRVLRLVPSWRMKLNIRMKCYERTFSLIDSITEHHCSPVDYWACSNKNGHSLWSLNDI